ncbi:hypothetical protein CXK86_20670 [Paenibacillus sp. BGI2013]|uniref:Uncharacterized protein n=1 Tax=Paenibacillus amylolyticus TaxID=1451 RepID=A0ABD8B2Y2_PAEAM|nr:MULTISPECIES: hypothetical protein [unclassified Paenibacillus]PJN59371.1 hypothetical protein PAEAM_30020 [Paenibacillus sp. GM1FR]PKQ89460.1 hypothetical protein CXK86_20670 [Paenibacillus sp. BGI2013]
MNTLDVVINLLETGKSLSLLDNQTNGKMNKRDAIHKIAQIINELLGYDRTTVVTNYIDGKLNLKNTILKLVVKDIEISIPYPPESIVGNIGHSYSNSNLVTLPIKNPVQSYFHGKCIEAVRKASEQYGSFLSRSDYTTFAQNNQGYPCAETIIKYLGQGSTKWKIAISNALQLRLAK